MKNQEYFDKSEAICAEKLEQFNNKYHIFNDLGSLHSGSSIDFTGITITDKIANIELKNRNITSTEYPTIIIEPHKYCKLIIDWLYDGKEPLYINFTSDGYVLVHNLRPDKTKAKPVFGEKKKYQSIGYNSFELSTRIELDVNDAIKYNMNDE